MSRLQIETPARVLEILFPVDQSSDEVELGEDPYVTAARAAERWISRFALISSLCLIIMMVMRVVGAWLGGRL
ncbi:hypothetical protein [Sphingomonas sp.]|uniref:hypothetical protein n=1 Tax=Sphingomonas sp. TaxID=28214 RepID=UPI00257D7D8F|nr:hypothetical protein [Sphingomonas sp.]